ncbi:MAG: cupin domain-containing protein [Bryobacteraceae bacterium]
MKLDLFLAAGLVALAAGHALPPTVVVDEGPAHHLLYTPGDIQWRPGPPSLPPGSEYAILEGDPDQPGIFTMRFRFPDGYRIPPHWHPNVERVAVLSGVFRLGVGETMDSKAATPLGPGS